MIVVHNTKNVKQGQSKIPRREVWLSAENLLEPHELEALLSANAIHIHQSQHESHRQVTNKQIHIFKQWSQYNNS